MRDRDGPGHCQAGKSRRHQFLPLSPRNRPLPPSREAAGPPLARLLQSPSPLPRPPRQEDPPPPAAVLVPAQAHKELPPEATLLPKAWHLLSAQPVGSSSWAGRLLALKEGTKAHGHTSVPCTRRPHGTPPASPAQQSKEGTRGFQAHHSCPQAGRGPVPGRPGMRQAGSWLSTGWAHGAPVPQAPPPQRGKGLETNTPPCHLEASRLKTPLCLPTHMAHEGSQRLSFSCQWPGFLRLSPGVPPPRRARAGAALHSPPPPAHSPCLGCQQLVVV